MFKMCFVLLFVGLALGGCASTSTERRFSESLKHTIISKDCGNDVATKALCVGGGMVGIFVVETVGSVVNEIVDKT